jgi:hypothetical protein
MQLSLRAGAPNQRMIRRNGGRFGDQIKPVPTLLIALGTIRPQGQIDGKFRAARARISPGTSSMFVCHDCEQLVDGLLLS